MNVYIYIYIYVYSIGALERGQSDEDPISTLWYVCIRI